MAPEKRSIRQRVDDALTTYLRNTTTDQEILDFYGEGNIVGRKGIPATDRELLSRIEASNALATSPLRPTSSRSDYAVGGIDQEIGYDYKTSDLSDTFDPQSKRPWQMTFGELPKDFGSSSLTPAARQYLADFRVPRNTGSDFSFATGPNVEDRIDFETKQLLEDPIYKRRPDLLEERLSEIRGQSSKIGDFSGQPQTPRTWQERGYISEKPENFKANVLAAVKDKVFEAQGPFGGVSTLTPVRQGSATNPDWRADLYERAGLAGPVSAQGYSSGYGGGTKDVQRFTTGSERLLPLQPYSEFFQNVSGGTRESALGTKPAPDFTPFQKAVGPRNYLLGKNILEGRGSLGAGFRGALSVGAADLIPSREAVQSFYKGDTTGGLQRMAGDFASGIPLALGTGVLATAVPAVAPLVPPVAAALTTVAAGSALDEAVKQQTGEGIVPKVRQFLGTQERSGVTNRPQPARPFVQPTIVPTQEKNPLLREWQNRFGLARERFNPAKGEFGLSELLFNR